jgi:TPR repeat protein
MSKLLVLLVACAALSAAACNRIDVSPQAAAEKEPASVVSEELLDRARGGDAEAQFRVAERYAKAGREARVEELPQALYWYSKAAERGFAPAQRALGAMLVEGVGVPRDPDEGRAWLERAAEQGDAQAAVMLAELARESDPSG